MAIIIHSFCVPPWKHVLTYRIGNVGIFLPVHSISGKLSALRPFSFTTGVRFTVSCILCGATIVATNWNGFYCPTLEKKAQKSKFHKLSLTAVHFSKLTLTCNKTKLLEHKVSLQRFVKSLHNEFEGYWVRFPGTYVHRQKHKV